MSLRDRWQELAPADRLKIGYALIVVLVLAIAYSALLGLTAKTERRLTGREAALTELIQLRQRYREASTGAQKLTNRLAAVAADDSPAKLLEEIGIKGKNSQIKPLKGEDRAGYQEDAAEIRIEGVTANEAVNLLYRLEKGAKPVVVRKANLKTRYDDPARLDLVLNVALLKPSAQVKK